MNRFVDGNVVVKVRWRRWRRFGGIVVVFDTVEDDVYEKCENEGGYDQSFAHDGHDVGKVYERWAGRRGVIDYRSVT